MADLPSETVTFLLTDVEGSTALWEDALEAMRLALVRHDALFEAIMQELGGTHSRPRGEGDRRFAVFTGAPGAVAGPLRTMIQGEVAALRTTLGEAAFAAAWAAGRALTMEQAVAEALEAIDDAQDESATLT